MSFLKYKMHSQKETDA